MSFACKVDVRYVSSTTSPLQSSANKHPGGNTSLCIPPCWQKLLAVPIDEEVEEAVDLPTANQDVIERQVHIVLAARVGEPGNVRAEGDRSLPRVADHG